MSDNFKQLCEIYFVAVLTSWKKRYPEVATYHRLARALKNPAVGQAEVADKYCSP